MVAESKRVKNPIEVRAVAHLVKDGDNIESVKVCYTVTATEYEISEARMLPLLETPELRRAVKDFAEEAVRQIDIHEEIAEEDSLIEYPIPPSA